MAVKTITITEKAYNTLKAMKKVDESFSEEINRIGAEKRPISDFFGLLKDSGQSAEEMQRAAKVTREKASGSMRKRHDSFRHFSGN